MKLDSATFLTGTVGSNSTEAHHTPRRQRLQDFFEMARQPQGGNSNSHLQRELNELKKGNKEREDRRDTAVNFWRTTCSSEVDAACAEIQRLLPGDLGAAERCYSQAERQLTSATLSNEVDSAEIGAIQRTLEHRLHAAGAAIEKTRSDQIMDGLRSDVRLMRDSNQTTNSALAALQETLNGEIERNAELSKQLSDSTRRMEMDEMKRRAEMLMKTKIQQFPTGSTSVSFARPRIKLMEAGPRAKALASALVSVMNNEEIVTAAVSNKLRRYDIAKRILNSPELSDGRNPTIRQMFEEHVASFSKTVQDENAIPAILTMEINQSLRFMVAEARKRTPNRQEQVQGIRDMLGEYLTPRVANRLGPVVKD